MNTTLAAVRRSGLWQNNWLLGLLILIIAINIAISGLVAFQVPPESTVLPVRFTSLTQFDQTGTVHDFYLITGLSWLILLVNTALATAVYHRSRITSFMLIIVSLGLSLFVFQTVTFYIGVIHGTS